jgi:hypothetical protein
MLHVRVQLRQAVKSALTGLSTTAANVFVDRVYPVQTDQTPCLLLSVGDTVELDGVDGIQRRTFSVRVEALAKLSENLSNVLDQVGLEVEEALSEPITFGGKDGNYLIYTGAEAPTLNGDGETPVGSLVMNFELLAFTQASAPDALL